jgi:acetyl coenzyme A synthetase (ADP forming)-like protein
VLAWRLQRSAAVIPAHNSEAVLRDGTSILIRMITPDDRERVRSVFDRMGPESVRHRFFGAKAMLQDSDLAYLATLDGSSRVALAATATHGDHEQILGIGRYIGLPGEHSNIAEIAFDVADADQGRGIGTLLLEHLATIARGAGISMFRAEVEADNAQMLEVFGRCGFAVRETLYDHIHEIEFPIDDTEGFLCAAGEREREAVGRSLRPFFAPASVAVIGVSRQPQTIGRAIFDNLVRDGFRGPIYPINPQASEIGGRRCFPSVSAVGSPIDLAIIAAPAPAVEALVTECAAAGVRGVVVITAGFAEVSAAGHAAELRLRAIARGAGMRIVGPNCMGALSTDPAVRLNATFSPVFPGPGNVSMVSQSGALGLAMIDRAHHLELGMASFVSIGNKADVSVNDVLSYWHRDPRTRVIALYLESFGNPRTFARLAPVVGKDRPIVAVKSGRSAAGTRAAASHSASLASLDVGIDALFAQTGVIRTDTLEQLFDVVSLLSSQPIPDGPRIGVVTNAGGPGILLADACEARGLTLPALAAPTIAALRALLPAQAGLSNPIDMIASASAVHYAKTIELVGNDPNVDAVVAIYVPPLVTRPEDIAAGIALGAGAMPSTKPIATVFLSSQGTPALLSRGPRGAIPSYSFPENVAMAMSAAVRYAHWRKRPVGSRLQLTSEQEQAVRARVRAWGENHASTEWLPFAEIAALLAIIGIRVVAHRTTTPDPLSAAAAARELGFPVVLKAIAPGLVHKTEVGGVVLDLESPEDVATAVEAMRARIPVTGFLVQQQVPRGVEALVGVTLDPSLGQLLVAGIGGVAVELYRDVAFRVTPLSDLDATEMLDQLRGRVLLDGFRGAPPVDRAALIDVIQRIAALVELVPELDELDLNPVVVLEQGRGAIAVDGRMRLGASR